MAAGAARRPDTVILDPILLLLATLAVTLAAVVQRVTGMGAGLISAPLLALISLDLVPGPLIFASIALTVPMTVAGRAHVRFRGAGFAAGGILLGSLAGAAVLNRIPVQQFGVTFGLVILAAVALSCSGLRVRRSPRNLFLSGTVSGITGIIAAIGAPPLALIYQHEDGPTIRATLALLFLASAVFMVALLHYVGRFGQNELINGLCLMPAFLLGNFIGRPLARFVDKGYARIAILALSAASALVVIVKNL